MGLMDFFKPKYKHNDWNVRKEAVQKLDNESKLIEILKNDESSSVREVAVQKINDKKVLKDTAKNDHDAYVRLLAAERIDDQKTLEELAINGKNSARGLAIIKLTNEEILADIASNAKLHGDRQIAKNRLKQLNPNLFEDTDEN